MADFENQDLTRDIVLTKTLDDAKSTIDVSVTTGCLDEGHVIPRHFTPETLQVSQVSGALLLLLCCCLMRNVMNVIETCVSRECTVFCTNQLV